jgi:hypothetical protein
MPALANARSNSFRTPLSFAVMPKRHAQLKEYSIGPSKGSTANCVQPNEVQTKNIMIKHVVAIRSVCRAGLIHKYRPP